MIHTVPTYSVLSELREQYLLTWKVRLVGVRILPKISKFVLNSSESWEKSVRYKRVNRNTLSFKEFAAYN